LSEANREIANQDEIELELLKFLTKDESLRIAIHMNNRFKYKFEIPNFIGQGYLGHHAEDITNQAVESFLMPDSRKWYKDKTFKKQFYGALDSIISNLVKKGEKEFKATESIELHLTLASEDDNLDALLEDCHKILSASGASEDELLLFEPYIIGEVKRSVIAKSFGYSEQKTTNIQKRLDRRIPKLRVELSKIGYGE
jgi:hypothetical protein